MPGNAETRIDPDLLETAAAFEADFLERPKTTIKPALDIAGAATEGGVDALRKIRAGAREPVDLGPLLGRGGIGIVHLAEQVSLGRWVALKALQPQYREDRKRADLLREAWVTGSLEHPNVVPVYDVGVDAEGEAFLLLKRIEGEDWRSWMSDSARIQQRFGVDALEWNLRTLMTVCNAVHYAHSRRVLHRDLKPDNVMIGAFGEVYLVDWGLAVTLDGGDERIPRAADQSAIAGTPGYMAPEMLAKGRLDERTDVYLLGGLLYEILAGVPPHKGNTLPEILADIRQSEPDLPPDTPAEIALVCRAALARDPADRPASAEELRRGIQQFLSNRGAARLVAEARARLAELEALLGEPEVDRTRAYGLFSECRFGFQHALAEWPDSAQARLGLAVAVERMVGYELSQGRGSFAATLIADHPYAPSELAQRVARAAQAETTRGAALDQIRREHDPWRGRRTRLFFGFAAALAWSWAPVLVALPIERFVTRGPSYAAMAACSALLLAFVTAMGLVLHRGLFATAMSRLLVGFLLTGLSMQLLLPLGAFLAGIPPHLALVVHLLLWATITALVAVAVNPRLFVAAAAYAAAFLAAAWRPDSTYLLFVGANLVLVVNLLWVGGSAPGGSALPWKDARD